MSKFKKVFVLAIWSLMAGVSVHAQLLSPDEYEKKMKETRDYTVVDVRTESEFVQGHLSNAVSIDIYRKDFREQLAKLNKNKPVFVYCAVGGRSNAAAGQLKSLGFNQVYDLRGGIKAWSQAGKATVTH